MIYIGLDIGGTKISVVKSSENLKIEKKISFKTEDFNSTFCRIITEIENMGDFDAIGISCGGPLDLKKGIIMSPPNLPGWDNVEIVKILEDKFKKPVFLQNDADACALAEWMYGAGKGTKNMIFLTFGTGLGAGLILDGKLYSGTTGSAGEIGHIRMTDEGPVGFNKKGSFEGYCSGGGIAKLGKILAKEKKVNFFDENGNITAKSIAEAAKKGDADGILIYEKSGEMLGKGLAVLIDIFNPEKIVIGSVYQRSNELLKKAMRRELEKECIKESLDMCEICPALLGDEIGDIAALCVAINGMSANKDTIYERYPALYKCKEEIEKAKEILIDTYKNNGKILVCGNGGSAADCEHIVGELMKGFMLKREVSDNRIPEELRANLQGALPAISLPSQSGIISAFANDVAADMVYAQLVYGYGRENDLLIAITTSGNSKNIINAAKVAKAIGVKVVALTGEGGGEISSVADVTIKAPEKETYKVQEYHLPVYHYLSSEAEKYFFL